MKSGRELDALVAEKVMGWRRCVDAKEGQGMTRPWFTIESFGVCLSKPTKPGCSESWSPSTNIAAAWEVVEKIGLLRGDVALSKEFDSTITGYSGFWAIQEFEGELRHVIAKAQTAPLVICLAALKAAGVPTEE